MKIFNLCKYEEKLSWIIIVFHRSLTFFHGCHPITCIIIVLQFNTGVTYIYHIAQCLPFYGSLVNIIVGINQPYTTDSVHIY